MKKYMLIAALGLLSTNLMAQDGPKADRKERKEAKKEYKVEKKTYHGDDQKAAKKKEKAMKKGYRREVKEEKGK